MDALTRHGVLCDLDSTIVGPLEDLADQQRDLSSAYDIIALLNDHGANQLSRASGDEMLQLNVGGSLSSVQRRHLTRCSGSLLNYSPAYILVSCAASRGRPCPSCSAASGMADSSGTRTVECSSTWTPAPLSRRATPCLRGRRAWTICSVRPTRDNSLEFMTSGLSCCCHRSRRS
mmetsp:Transcript_32843/g.94788  ORF Transcript_32843/g.94788 Transcript_32843/m.94788 type:complete len:175 (-) Transcript_32843:1028-1552(-)